VVLAAVLVLFLEFQNLAQQQIKAIQMEQQVTVMQVQVALLALEMLAAAVAVLVLVVQLEIAKAEQVEQVEQERTLGVFGQVQLQLEQVVFMLAVVAVEMVSLLN